MMEKRESESLDVPRLSGSSERSHSSGTGTEDFSERFDAPKNAIAKKEEKLIGKFRVLIFVLLVLAVVAVGTGAFLFLSEQEQTEFENEFSAKFSELGSIAKDRADRLFATAESIAVTAMSPASADDSSNTWPYTIVRDWWAKALTFEKLIDVNGSRFSIFHIVEHSQLDNFTKFMEYQTPKMFEEAVEYGITNKTVEELMDNTIPYPWQFASDLSFVFPSNEKRVTSMIAAEVFPLEISPLGTTYVNMDIQNDESVRALFKVVDATRNPALSFFESLDPEDRSIESQIMYPIFESSRPKDRTGRIVGLVFVVLSWNKFLQSLATSNDYSNMVVVLESQCTFGSKKDKLEISFHIDENHNIHEWTGGNHEHGPRYDALVESIDLINIDIDPTVIHHMFCVPKVIFSAYPTKKLEESYTTPRPIIMTSIVIVIFAITSLTFLLYDHFVRQRRDKYMKRLEQQEVIVSDLFPTAVRDRLYGDFTDSTRRSRLLKAGDYDPDSPPLADLFLNTTIIFADIVGFTAWSSAREPEQVFILLESIYRAFDGLAHRYNVFKVETVGDCYVAAVGLPEPQEDHALIACRFASKCVKKMNEMTEKLEVTLGPDTADLDIRVGIHSGQVTAGVLRGERSRFQLFGDTMNTAARMESSGARRRVHLSEATANILIKKGLSSNVEARPQKIFIKGKGEMQTYWFHSSSNKLEIPENQAIIERERIVRFSNKSDETDLSTTEEHLNEDSDLEDFDASFGMTKTERLVEWNVKVLSSLLQQIIASRGGRVKDISHLAELELKFQAKKTIVLEEFKPIIPLKRFKKDDLITRCSPNSIVIGEKPMDELRNFVSNVAMLYQDNPFHNFEHASHVTASVKKLLKRIVTVDESEVLQTHSENRDVKLEDIAGHSYGITSDPLTHFAVVFSALIHDVDHPGVPNTQLLKENARNAQIYRKSIAEQNSVDLSWKLLMSDEFKTFRACIYQTDEEFKRFRQLVVNTVMATDIADKELQELRKARWNAAFSELPLMESLRESEDRKATIVIEYLIQASDVSHTMQHWHIYKRWNERFFMECYGAFRNGRAETDPSIGWYNGEIGFFDFYIIPLAKKLDSCGVFGVSSHEYLNYASGNRDEWKREGENIVKEFLAKYEREYGRTKDSEYYQSQWTQSEFEDEI